MIEVIKVILVLTLWYLSRSKTRKNEIAFIENHE